MFTAFEFKIKFLTNLFLYMHRKSICWSASGPLLPSNLCEVCTISVFSFTDLSSSNITCNRVICCSWAYGISGILKSNYWWWYSYIIHILSCNTWKRKWWQALIFACSLYWCATMNTFSIWSTWITHGTVVLCTSTFVAVVKRCISYRLMTRMRWRYDSNNKS